MIKCPTEQLETWLTTWRNASSQDRHDTRFTWQKHLVTLLTEQKPLNSKGPTAATIIAVVLTGWKPSRPDLWAVDKETTITLNSNPFTRFQLIARAQNDLQEQNWKTAAAHEHGGGFET